MSITVDIWADVNCPFCYLGKARFAEALAAFDDDVTVVNHSFELDPTIPPSTSEPVVKHIADKYGISTQQAAANEERIGAQAAEMGLPYQTAGRDYGSSFDMHRLLHLAAEHGKQNQLLDALYHANFGDSERLFGNDERLAAIAIGIGLDEATVRRTIDDKTAYADDVRRDEQRATEIGVTGVPFFVFGGKYAVSGAQPVEVFTQALRAAVDDPAPHST